MRPWFALAVAASVLWAGSTSGQTPPVPTALNELKARLADVTAVVQRYRTPDGSMRSLDVVGEADVSVGGVICLFADRMVIARPNGAFGDVSAVLFRETPTAAAAPTFMDTPPAVSRPVLLLQVKAQPTAAAPVAEDPDAAKIAWREGAAVIPWPEKLAPKDGEGFLVEMEDMIVAVALQVRVLGPRPASAVERAAALADAGCEAQAVDLLMAGVVR